MDYKEQIEQAKHAAEKWREKHRIVGVGEFRVDCMVDDLTRSITDLLARAEAAEKELAECREKNAGLALALLTEQPPNSDCLGDQEWQAVRNRVREAEARAEKAERERDAAVRQLASLEICGYCKNGQCTTRGGTKECKWEWNGGQKEE